MILIHADRPFPLRTDGEDIELFVTPGVTVDELEAIEDMKRRTHDGAINMTGQRRRSGVTWHLAYGQQACESVLRDLYADDAESWAMIEQQYLPFLAAHGDRAVLVVATCDVAVSR